MPDNLDSFAAYAPALIDAGIILFFLSQLPQIKSLSDARDLLDEEWLVESRVFTRKFRFFMGLRAMLLTTLVVLGRLILQAQTVNIKFVVMALPVALITGLLVGLCCAFFSFQAVTFWLMRARVKAMLCVMVFFALIHGCLFR